MVTVAELVDMLDKIVEALKVETGVTKSTESEESLLQPVEAQTEPAGVTGVPTGFEMECGHAEVDEVKLLQELARFSRAWTERRPPTRSEQDYLQGQLGRSRDNFRVLMKCHRGLGSQLDQMDTEVAIALQYMTAEGPSQKTSKNAREAFSQFQKEFRGLIA